MEGFNKIGLYDPKYEHDACGIGGIASIDGTKTHELVLDALSILIHLEHRGGTGSESNSGDGAGILIQIPHEFFKKLDLGFEINNEGDYAVIQTFLSKNDHFKENGINLIKETLIKYDLELLGIRDVPINDIELGNSAKASMPYICQFFIKKPISETNIEFERHLYLCRRIIENKALELKIPDFYICSMSSKTIVYKGMLVSTQVQGFYVDLNDTSVKSAIATVHSRFSTNTFPSWSRAHPYRMLCHNGEINTIKGNVDGVKAREGLFESKIYKEHLKDLLPVIANMSSDSAMVDNFIEFLVMNGRSIEEAIMLLVPEPWTKNKDMDLSLRSYFEFNSTFMEPWDGPAAILFTDGDKLGATLDRNGLRPLRYCQTKDNRIIFYSETGSLPINDKDIIYKSRLNPGSIIVIDTKNNKILSNDEIKNYYANKKPYSQYVKNIIKLKDPCDRVESISDDRYNFLIKSFDYSLDDINNSIIYVAKNKTDKTVAMGYDKPLSVLSNRSHLLYDYFHQNFAQVTNPPIDSIRENIVTSQRIYVGREGNLINPNENNCKRIKLNSPIISLSELEEIKELKNIKTKCVDILYSKNENLEDAIERICLECVNLINNGTEVLILTDENSDEFNIPIPALLISSSVHNKLTQKSLRTHASIILDSYEPREIHHFATLVGYGVTAICPRLVFEVIRRQINKALNMSYTEAVKGYIEGITSGITKIMSKMGISTIQSYNGTQIFEIIGLDRLFVSKYFPNTRSAISGIGINDIDTDIKKRYYSINDENDDCALDKEAISLIQEAAIKNDYSLYKKYSNHINSKLIHLRDLFDLDYHNPISIDSVENEYEIVKRFSIGAMSFGAISKEAHEVLASAMNKLKAMSNSGEGGEAKERYNTIYNSSIKQVASGRFGVNIEYLCSANEIQIKIAQGAKPGEGGNLPKNKVYPWIAEARHSTPGVQLISPPPHHDIYSIEDLAQLIYDLKNANPDAVISVKLVSEAGVGTVASGVVKAGANKILISGFDGGTGAAPKTSVNHAGIPFEIGLSEAHQTLILNNLRQRVKLEVDGKLLTGRDIVIAALLGADLFSFASLPLIVIGCKMLKVCNLNTCPFGVATQDEKLRNKFSGKDSYVINLMLMLAKEVREIMASLGFHTVDEMIGHVEYIKPRAYRGLDFDDVLYKKDCYGKTHEHFLEFKKIDLRNTLDSKKLIPLAMNTIKYHRKSKISVLVENTNRAIGTYLSSYLVKNNIKLDDNDIEITAIGNAGNSCGAFLTKGVTLNIKGDANDYLGKGLSGGIISLTVNEEFNGDASKNIIAGNVLFYGATQGFGYINGICGERFGVRNSGASLVTISVGSHGLEYMTGGKVLILDKIGKNFASGMSGGVAFIRNTIENINNINLSIATLYNLNEDDYLELKELLASFIEYTNSDFAKNIINNLNINDYIKLVPNDYYRVCELIKKYQNEDNYLIKVFNEAIK